MTDATVDHDVSIGQIATGLAFFLLLGLLLFYDRVQRLVAYLNHHIGGATGPPPNHGTLTRVVAARRRRRAKRY